MAKFALFNARKQVVHEFEAVDIPAARAAAALWVQQNKVKVWLVGLIRVFTPTQVPPSTSVADDPA